MERAYGSFFRRFNLPDTADTDKISAKCENGVLHVTIPKHEKVQPRKITVEG
jgi:HSP20 family protein